MTAEKISLDLASVECDAFEPHVGSKAVIRRKESSSELEAVLDRAETVGQRVEGRRHAFSLTFKVTCGDPMGISQGLFAVDHPAFEAFDLFLVPIAADKDSVFLEAVVN